MYMILHVRAILFYTRQTLIFDKAETLITEGQDAKSHQTMSAQCKRPLPLLMRPRLCLADAQIVPLSGLPFSR
jgi:hypothetical protein